MPPLDDPRRLRLQALGIADALHTLGYSAEALRLVEVASSWRADDEREAARRASWGKRAEVWLGETMPCVRVVPRSLSLATGLELVSWKGAALAGGRGDALGAGAQLVLMLRDDVLLRMIERMAEAVGGFLRGEGPRTRSSRRSRPRPDRAAGGR